ncbi:hypothetical protein DDY07_18825 [Methylomonas sp. ZR1]|nr:hypothetical protein [Methylomonas sp. ZR1]
MIENSVSKQSLAANPHFAHTVSIDNLFLRFFKYMLNESQKHTGKNAACFWCGPVWPVMVESQARYGLACDNSFVF